jgi:hypothetical protein
MDCAGGVLTLEPGWWYESEVSSAFAGTTAVFKCLNPSACMVVNKSIVQCSLYATGPLCAVCLDGYVPDASAVVGLCKFCTSSSIERWGNKILLLIAATIAVFVLGLIVLTRPAQGLKIDPFLVQLNVRRIVRRTRKRVLLKLHKDRKSVV